jgi:hypothetical protein
MVAPTRARSLSPVTGSRLADRRGLSNLFGLRTYASCHGSKLAKGALDALTLTSTSVTFSMRAMARHFTAAVLTVLLLSMLPCAAAADAEPAETAPVPAETTPPATETTPAATETTPPPTETKPRKLSFAVVPGPFYNPNLGLGLNVLPMLMFYPNKNDTVSPPSLVLLNTLYAIKPPFDDAGSRQSVFLSAATRIYLDEDRWRIVGMAAYINLFQEFYGVGGDANYSDPQFGYRLEQVIVIAQIYRQILWKGFYVGALIGFTTFHTRTDDPEDAQVLDDLGSGADWRTQPNIGLLAQYDTRDSKYYPARGVNFNLRVNGSFKEDESYLLLAPSFNQYFPLLDKDRLILAYRIFGQFGFGNLPMAAYAHYGMRGTTLGYETGEYMDKMMTGAEVEIRWMAWQRVGFEGGVGVGKVFSDFSEFVDEPWLPGVWGGATYKIMEEHDIRARITLAYGKSGLLFYFAVGQNF